MAFIATGGDFACQPQRIILEEKVHLLEEGCCKAECSFGALVYRALCLPLQRDHVFLFQN